MKKILPLLACVSLLLASGCGASRQSAKSSSDSSSSTDFTISYAGTGTGDSYVLVSVTCSASSTDAAASAAAKYAVLGLMYKGCAATATSPEMSPLIKTGTSLNSDQSAWMSSFLGGDYAKYVVSVAKDSMQLTKMKKGGYQVTATVSVDKRHLRWALEEQGIIRRLGF